MAASWQPSTSRIGHNYLLDLSTLSFVPQTLVEPAKTTPSRSIFIVGETGTGKSSFCLALASTLSKIESERILASQTFVPSDTPTAGSTKTAAQSITTRFGQFRIIDTPGLNDPEHRDKEYLDGIAQHMRTVADCSAIILVLPYRSPRFSASLQDAVNSFKAILGDLLMSVLVVVFTQAEDRLVKKNPIDTSAFVKRLQDFLTASDSRIAAVQGSIPSFLVDCDMMTPDTPFQHAHVLESFLATCFTNKAHNLASVSDAKSKLEQEQAQKAKMEEELQRVKREQEELRRRAQADQERRRQEEALRLLQEQQRRDEEAARLYKQKMALWYLEQEISGLQVSSASSSGYGYGYGGGGGNGGSSKVWICGRGVRYHYSKSCAGSTGGSPECVSVREAKSLGKSACLKCSS